MNKAILIGAIAAVTLMGCEDGSYFDKDTMQGKSDAVMRLTATGNDLRVYEFTPQTMDHMQCIFVSGTKKGGLWCEPKLNYEHEIPQW